MSYAPNNDSDCRAWYRLESGALTTDSSGEGNTLTNSNGVTNSTDHKEGSHSAEFDAGSSQCLYRSDGDLAAGFPGKTGDSVHKITVCCWVQFDTVTPAAPSGVVRKYDYASNWRSWGINLKHTSSELVWVVGYNSGAAYEYAEFGTACQTGRWYHVGCTFDGASGDYRLRVWDDTAGALLDSDVTGTWSDADLPGTAAPLVLGAYLTDLRFHDGHLDDVVIFSDVLSADDIDAIRNQTYDPGGAGLSIPVAMAGYRRRRGCVC